MLLVLVAALPQRPRARPSPRVSPREPRCARPPHQDAPLAPWLARPSPPPPPLAPLLSLAQPVLLLAQHPLRPCWHAPSQMHSAVDSELPPPPRKPWRQLPLRVLPPTPSRP
eukprot:scaffold69689_cov21-Tisochrysis_lutea.AAC.5